MCWSGCVLPAEITKNGGGNPNSGRYGPITATVMCRTVVPKQRLSEKFPYETGLHNKHTAFNP